MLRRLVARACAVIAIAAAGAGCGSGDPVPESRVTGEAVTVYSSLPMRGPLAAVSRDIVRAEKLALREAGGRAGIFAVGYVPLDSADRRTGRWSARRVAGNARIAVQDRQAIAYLGELDGGASTVSLPILNAGGILQVSPRETYAGLTRPGDPGEPERWSPSGAATFARLVPDDDAQAAALVSLARARAIRRLAIAGDDRPAGARLGDRVAARAEAAGIDVVLREELGGRDAQAAGLGRRVRRAGADGFLLAGGPRRAGPDVLRAVARAAPRARLLAGDDAALAPSFARRVGATVARRLRIVGVVPERGPGAAAFERRFARVYGARPRPEAVLGYRAMRLVLDAVRQAGEDAGSRRAVVRRALVAAVRPAAGLAVRRVQGRRVVTIRSHL